MGNDDVSISDMLDNMADPAEQKAKKVDCPIDGCDYTGEPESVSGHVSASSQSDHIWANTQYAGWKEFNRVKRNQVEEQLSRVKSDNSGNSSEVQIDASNGDSPSTAPPGGDVSQESVECPVDNCTEESDVVDIAVHVEQTHSWSDTPFENRTSFYDWVIGSD